jgi:hypothetical protein
MGALVWRNQYLDLGRSSWANFMEKCFPVALVAALIVWFPGYEHLFSFPVELTCGCTTKEISKARFSFDARLDAVIQSIYVAPNL